MLQRLVYVIFNTKNLRMCEKSRTFAADKGKIDYYL